MALINQCRLKNNNGAKSEAEMKYSSLTNIMKTIIALIIFFSPITAFAADTIISTTINYAYNIILVLMAASSSALGIIGLSLIMSSIQLVEGQGRGGLASTILIGLFMLAAGTGSAYTTIGVELGLVNTDGTFQYGQSGSGS